MLAAVVYCLPTVFGWSELGFGNNSVALISGEQFRVNERHVKIKKNMSSVRIGQERSQVLALLGIPDNEGEIPGNFVAPSGSLAEMATAKVDWWFDGKMAYIIRYDKRLIVISVMPAIDLS
jgi:hypothetical protein